MTRSAGPAIRRVLAGSVCLGVLLGACSDSGSSADRQAQSPAARSTATQGTGQNGCTKIISAIGWTQFMLVRRGHEAEQDFRSGVRGRLAYVEGAVVQNSDSLPGAAAEPAHRLERITHRIVDLDTDRAEQVAGLRRYWLAVDDVKAACARSQPS